MNVLFSDLTAADWAEFEQHAPAACAWLLRRAEEREYARLEALPIRDAWQERRMEDLRQARLVPSAHPWSGGGEMVTNHAQLGHALSRRKDKVHG